MKNLLRLIVPTLSAALLAVGIAWGANTTFFTSIGDQVIPLTRTTLDSVVIGGTTPAAGNFTTLSATSTVTGAGFSTRLAAPGPIGSTTPSTGAFTSLALTGPLTSSYGTPTITSGACGATTNGTVSGSNASGTVTIGAATTTVCTVNFSTTLAAAPRACVISPATSGTAALTTLAYVSSISTTVFVITGSVLESTTWRYICL